MCRTSSGHVSNNIIKADIMHKPHPKRALQGNPKHACNVLCFLVTVLVSYSYFSNVGGQCRSQPLADQVFSCNMKINSRQQNVFLLLSG